MRFLLLAMILSACMTTPRGPTGSSDVKAVGDLESVEASSHVDFPYLVKCKDGSSFLAQEMDMQLSNLCPVKYFPHRGSIKFLTAFPDGTFQVHCVDHSFTTAKPEEILDGKVCDLSEPNPNPDFHLSVGDFHACALDSEGIKCWGNNNFGQLNVPDLKIPRQVTVGQNHSCALHAEGIKCWGDNKYGQLYVPEFVNNPKQIAAGEFFTCAIDAKGVVCWGKDFIGEGDALGYADHRFTDFKKPTQIAVGFSHFCVLDGAEVKCEGDSLSGALNVPVLKNPTKIAVNFWSSCAVDASGMQCWGRDSYSFANKHSSLLKARGEAFCEFSDNKVSCWKSTMPTQALPAFDSLVDFGVSRNSLCTLDLVMGLKCWTARGTTVIEVEDLPKLKL